MAIVSTRKHIESFAIENPDIPKTNETLSFMTRMQTRKYLHSVMLNSAISIMDRFRSGNAVYVIDANTQSEGLVVDDGHRHILQSEARELCVEIKNLYKEE